MGDSDFMGEGISSKRAAGMLDQIKRGCRKRARETLGVWGRDVGENPERDRR